jgi:hypothetical protein
MAESKSSGSEFVQNGWIDVLVVIVAESILKWQQTKVLHFGYTDYDGQPFVVGNVLHLSNQNAPGLLVESLVIPKRVQVGELRHKSVVFTHENGVRDSQVGVFVRPRITCDKSGYYAILRKIVFGVCIFLTCFEALDIFWSINSRNGLNNGSLSGGSKSNS